MRTVFVSSTFKDMQMERDAIRDTVAPIINEKAYAHGDRIDFCDLRWGINTEELDTDECAKKVLDVCFREIDRSNPPMIIILGDRYGWIPDANVISNAANIRQLKLEDLEKSITALEIEYGAILKKRRALVYIREIVGDNIPTVYNIENSESLKKLNKLKERIEKLENCSISFYSLRIENGIPIKEDINIFSNIVVNDLEKVLINDWEKYDKLTPFEREVGRHWDFVINKRRMFLARQQDFEKCISCIENGEENLIICKGEVGSGKSTLLSKIAYECKQNGMEVLPLIGGLTDQTSYAADILDKEIYFLESQLRMKHTDTLNENVKDDIESLKNRMLDLCEMIKSTDKKILILVDAVDQLYQDDNRDDLVFVPTNMPDNVKIFITCTLDFQTNINISHILLPLEEEEKKKVIDGICRYQRKELSHEVVRNILNIEESDNPLYISLIVTRLIMMNSEDFEKINSSNEDANVAIAKHQVELLNKCSKDIENISVDVFKEIGKRINPKLGEIIFEMIALSRYGLRVEDLSNIATYSWSQLDFSRFINFLDEYFQVRSDGRYDFLHKCFRNGYRKLIEKENRKIKLNKDLVNHMEKLGENDPIYSSELVYHIIQSDDKDKFIDFMKKYALEYDKRMLIINAALVCREISLQDKGVWIIDTLKYASEKNEYIEVLWFVVKSLAKQFERTLEDLEVIIEILKKGENIFKEHKDMFEDMKYDIGFELYNNLSIFSNDILNHKDAYKYAELRLILEKNRLNGTDSIEDKVKLYLAYYNTLIHMKAYDDQDALRHALVVGKEGLEMMDERSWNALESEPYFLPYIDCMGEIYGRLGDLDNALRTYEEGLRRREAYYEKNPDALDLTRSISGGYFNVATVEQMYKTYPHFLRAYEFISKAIEILEVSGDLIKEFEKGKTKNIEAKVYWDNFLYTEISAAGRTYLMAYVIAGEIQKGYKSSYEVHCNMMKWFHKSMDINLYLYITFGLPADKEQYLKTILDMADYIRYISLDEYNIYKKINKRCLQNLVLKLYEESTEQRYRDLISTVMCMHEKIVKSNFQLNRDIAMELLIEYIQKAIKLLTDDYSKDIFKKSYVECNDLAIREIYKGGIREELVKEYIKIYYDIYGEDGCNEEERQLFIRGAFYGAIGNYYQRYKNIYCNGVIALDWFEKKALVNKRLCEMEDNIIYQINMANIYYVIGFNARGQEVNNPLWRKYWNTYIDITKEIIKKDPTKVDYQTKKEVERLLLEEKSSYKPDNSDIIKIIEGPVNSNEKLEVLSRLLSRQVFIFLEKSKVREGKSVPDDAFICHTNNTNKKELLIFTDRLTAWRYNVKNGNNEENSLHIFSFSTVYELIQYKSEEIVGIMLNPEKDNVFFSNSYIFKFVEIINKMSTNEKKEVTNKQIELNEKMINYLRHNLKYLRLKTSNNAQKEIIDAINSYANSVDINDVLAIDETVGTGWFRKKSEGILFLRDCIYSNYLKTENGVIYYNNIDCVSRYGEEVRITLKGGTSVTTYFGSSTDNVFTALKYIINVVK